MTEIVAVDLLDKDNKPAFILRGIAGEVRQRHTEYDDVRDYHYKYGEEKDQHYKRHEKRAKAGAAVKRQAGKGIAEK